MSKKVYTASADQPAEEPAPPENIIMHLRVDGASASKLSPRESGVKAYEEQDLFVAQPLEIGKGCEGKSGSSAEVPRYDPDDLRAEVPSEERFSDRGPTYALKVESLLKDFMEKNKDGEWPISTSNLCHWCCHGFPGTPIGIPRRFDQGFFHVTGCFCSFACAAAYNLDSGDDNTVMGNRHSLLCSLATRLKQGDEVSPAPPRLALSCFGGYLSIQEFRAFSDSDRVMIVNSPPMRSLTSQIEEVCQANVGEGYRFIPIQQVRDERGISDQLSLKRERPLLDLKNTLHSTMNVRIVPSVGDPGPGAAAPVITPCPEAPARGTRTPA